VSQEPKVRLDLLLAKRGLARSRSHAQDMIRRGSVLVDGEMAEKPASMVAADAEITFTQDEDFVSRGAHKLLAALDAFKLRPDGRVCMDVGASTGGFTEILLRHGARRVYAVDVGWGQLHGSLRTDPRVSVFEETDIRAIDPHLLPERPQAVTIDVSFISLLKVLPAALELTAPGCWLVALVKPQFEVGRENIGKGGIARDAAARLESVERVRAFVQNSPGWRVIGVEASPIAGQDGNFEFLLGAVHGE
jgi:23S rRNA (cytidine1920-2'-O)/16S rRNA (cytidine1409-2'-O)-methyltransferase